MSKISSWWHFKMKMNILVFNFACVFELVSGSKLTYLLYFPFSRLQTLQKMVTFNPNDQVLRYKLFKFGFLQSHPA